MELEGEFLKVADSFISKTKRMSFGHKKNIQKQRKHPRGHGEMSTKSAHDSTSFP